MQRKLVRKLDLEKTILKIEQYTKPNVHLEQYTISPRTAAELLYLAAYTYDDIMDKRVIDLGCGTGRLAIGSILLGAEEAVGLDIDRNAIMIASRNAEKLGVRSRIHWLKADLNSISGSFNTVLQNPPFGVQNRKADRVFLKKAIEIGDRIYSLHKASQKSHEQIKKNKSLKPQLLPASPSPFLKRFIQKHGGEIKGVYTMQMEIPHMFKFHRKRRYRFPIDLYIIERRKAS
jgi:putative methylase